MRIAFVGKGGSGKSTLSALFSSYLKSQPFEVVVFDADLNIDLPKLLGQDNFINKIHLSDPKNTKLIKEWLIGDNPTKNLGAFRKTTPPTRLSNIIVPSKIDQTPLNELALKDDKLKLFVVGTYESEDIGAVCYHNSLAILENILSHIDDKDTYVIADMVAGVDAFAGTLHSQFDMNVLVVEPTKRSIEVFNKYKDLSESAGVSDGLFVVGNKIESEEDKKFIETNIAKDSILGFLRLDPHLKEVDRGGSKVDPDKLLPDNYELLATINKRLKSLPDNRQKRLEKIWQLHEKYVSQDFVVSRFGDLKSQIDRDFSWS